jgi:RNA polymerase sigma-70 factor (family 1)
LCAFLLTYFVNADKIPLEPSLTYNEEKLLLDLKIGSEAAFTQLYHRYSASLYYNMLALVKDESVAEELVQDVFSKIWRRRETIRVDKSFAAYLFVAGRNRVYDFFQQLKNEHELYARIKAAATEQYSHIEETLFARENAQLLQKAIDTLPPQRRRAFELCKMQGLTYRQASENMGVSLSTLKDHIAHAYETIRVYISKNREVAIGLLFFLPVT